MRYNKIVAAVCLLFAVVLMAGCDGGRKETVTGTNYYYPQTEAESEIEETEEAVKAEFDSEYYMIIHNDMTAEYLVLKQMESGMENVFYYSLTTRFMDKYGNSTPVSYFEPGRVITIGAKDSEGKLKEAQISDVVWEYEDVVRFEIDEERGIFQIADTKYSYDEDLYVVSAGNEIGLSDINEEDELRVIGMNREIISVAVTTGHGTIALKNTELFEDSFIQIGNRIFAEITGEIELEVPEGTYMVTVANKGYGGSKEYEVQRDATTVVDLDELKGEGPKHGLITFKIGTSDENSDADISFRIDGEEVDYGEAVELAYGIHSIKAESFGYETYSKKLFVNSESATISITMDMESTGSVTVDEGDEDERDEDEDEDEGADDAGTNTNLAGSLAGSTSNGNTGNTSGSATDSDALIESLTNALTEDSTSDYLSTLTELLGSVLY